MVSRSDALAVPVRWAYLSMGLGFVALGVLGAILPLMPSTVFFILALWAFKRSSPRLEQRLLAHPVIGPTLQDWDRDKSMKRKTKIVAISLIWVCLAVSCLLVKKPFVYGILAAVGVCLTVYLASRKTAPPA